VSFRQMKYCNTIATSLVQFSWTLLLVPDTFNCKIGRHRQETRGLGISPSGIQRSANETNGRVYILVGQATVSVSTPRLSPATFLTPITSMPLCLSFQPNPAKMNRRKGFGKALALVSLIDVPTNWNIFLTHRFDRATEIFCRHHDTGKERKPHGETPEQRETMRRN